MATNRRGRRITKDGQSRQMRQNMAAGRNSRGEGPTTRGSRGMTSNPSEGRTKPTTSQQRSNRRAAAAASRRAGARDKVTTGQGRYRSGKVYTGTSNNSGGGREAPSRAVRGSQQNVNSLRNVGRDLLKMGSRVGVVASVFNQGTSKNDTQSSQGVQPYKPVKKVKYPTAAETQAEGRRRESAQAFDKAFANARKAGKTTFTWRGKTYNTKLKK